MHRECNFGTDRHLPFDHRCAIPRAATLSLTKQLHDHTDQSLCTTLHCCSNICANRFTWTEFGRTNQRVVLVPIVFGDDDDDDDVDDAMVVYFL